MNLAFLDSRSIVIFLLTFPLVVGLVTPIKKRSKALFYGIATTIPVLNVFLLFHQGYGAGSLALSGMFVFSFDRFSWLFAVLVNACWALTLLYSSAYLRHQFQDRAEPFHRYLSATVSLVLGAGLAGNFFTLVFFYVLSIPVIYPMIILRNDGESRWAGRMYFLSTFLPAMLLACPTVFLSFPAFAPFDQFTIQSLGYGPTHASLILGLLIIGFSKNCVAPFHMWLPYSAVAPTPVTALIHSVASVQTATIALLKITSQVYGDGYLASLNDHFLETGWITYLCGGTAIYTAYRAWKTPDLKKRFSYSTVGQLSYIITATLVGTRQTTLGAVLHLVTHSFAKLNLFFCAGIFMSVFDTVQAPGVAARIPGKRWLGIAATISGLSITGFPLLAGYYSKDLMLIEELHRHHYAAAFFLVGGSLINLVYIFPLIRASISPRLPTTPQSRPVPFAMAAAVVICTLIIVTFSQYVYVIMRMFE